MDLIKLKEYFPESDIEWRVGQGGQNAKGPWIICLAYVTNRAIMDRLDRVAGVGNWKNEYRPWRGNSQLCGISIKIDNEWVTKWDGADDTAIEGTKGGLSDSMKRAAVQWGIGRYLYKLPVTFGQIVSNGGNFTYNSKIKDVGWVKWDPPSINNLLKGANNG